MALGMKVGLGPGHIVLDREPAALPQKGAEPPIYDPFLLSPNSWMDEGVTYYGSRFRPRPHCIRRGPSSARNGLSSPPILSARVYCGYGRPTQLLLSSCVELLQNRLMPEKNC